MARGDPPQQFQHAVQPPLLGGLFTDLVIHRCVFQGPRQRGHQGGVVLRGGVFKGVAQRGGGAGVGKGARVRECTAGGLARVVPASEGAHSGASGAQRGGVGVRAKHGHQRQLHSRLHECAFTGLVARGSGGNNGGGGGDSDGAELGAGGPHVVGEGHAQLEAGKGVACLVAAQDSGEGVECVHERVTAVARLRDARGDGEDSGLYRTRASNCRPPPCHRALPRHLCAKRCARRPQGVWCRRGSLRHRSVRLCRD
mmetsp:Transcript_25768/g.64467  ORF Transcript_25768/g.64467 Transcript_25768/m.64467 type:complete len:255 (-) Transcript_25768:469-1233(-)